MIEFIYKTLASLGFTHPLHPVTAHVVMGMIMGGFLFKLASYKWKDMSKTADHCYIMALIFTPLTIILGLMDWAHRFSGVMNNLIVAKFVLAGAFTLLLSVLVYFKYKGNVGNKIIFTLYVLCLLAATGLGFVGGELVFG